MTTQPRSEVTVQRKLSKTKTATRHRLLEAAADLAREGGYEAVGMREVGARAGLSPATVYGYYSSKDQLLVDVLVERDREVSAALERRPPRGGTPRARTRKVLRRAIEQMERDPLLFAATLRAYISGAGPDSVPLSALISPRSWLRIAVGEDTAARRPAALHAIQDAYLAAMVQFAVGAPLSEIQSRLDGIVDLIFPEE